MAAIAGIQSFEQFCNNEIRRKDGKAEIIVGYFMDKPHFPVRLLGFIVDAELSDFEILEEGYMYYQLLLYRLSGGSIVPDNYGNEDNEEFSYE